MARQYLRRLSGAPRSSSRLTLFVTVALAVLLTSVLLVSCGGSSSSTSTSVGGTGSSTSTAPAAGLTSSTTATTTPGHTDVSADLFSPAQEVLDEVYPSVVNIVVKATVRGQTGEGVGSGVVYTADGLILTNAHVITLDGNVQTGQQVTVTLSDGSSYPATIVGVDNAKDIAAIQIQKTGLKPVTFANSSEVKLAEWAVVIGSPLDFRNSVSLGIVSGLDRTLDTGTGAPLTGLIQLDAAISPGNSGGGCFDTLARFIGMPEVYLPPGQTGAENIGFAIPADVVAASAKALTGK